MIEPKFDELIHSPTRLRICATLDGSRQVEFYAIEQTLDISTSLLSKQLKILTDAGYVELTRRRQPVGRPRVWVAFTPQGQRAFTSHVAALRALLTNDSANPSQTSAHAAWCVACGCRVLMPRWLLLQRSVP